MNITISTMSTIVTGPYVGHAMVLIVPMVFMPDGTG